MLLGDRIKSHKTCDCKTIQRQTTVSEANRRQEQSECYKFSINFVLSISLIFNCHRSYQTLSSENKSLCKQVTKLTDELNRLRNERTINMRSKRSAWQKESMKHMELKIKNKRLEKLTNTLCRVEEEKSERNKLRCVNTMDDECAQPHPHSHNRIKREVVTLQANCIKLRTEKERLEREVQYYKSELDDLKIEVTHLDSQTNPITITDPDDYDPTSSARKRSRKRKAEEAVYPTPAFLETLRKSKRVKCTTKKGKVYYRVKRIPDELALIGMKVMGGPANVPAAQVGTVIKDVLEPFVDIDKFQFPDRESFNKWRRTLGFITKVQIGAMLTKAHWTTQKAREDGKVSHA